jgi:SAM-dependent methyltransferase
MDNFANPRLKIQNLDLFVVRSALLRALKSRLPDFSGVLLDVGCGNMPYKALVLQSPSRVNTYIGLDLPPNEIYNGRPDLVWDGKKIPLPNDRVDCAMATEVLEHCPDPEAVLREVVRVLKRGGSFFFTVPFLWPLHDVPNDEFRYTPYSLRRLLCNAGFGEVQIEALGGWDASLAQMLGLWVRRRPMSSWKRGLLSKFVRPLIWQLLKNDIRPSLKLPTMITGLAGIARKP